MQTVGSFLEAVAKREEVIVQAIDRMRRGSGGRARSARPGGCGDGGAPRGGCARARGVRASERESDCTRAGRTVCTGCVTWPPPGGGLSVSLACRNLRGSPGRSRLSAGPRRERVD